jgi:hypothetical protein
VVIGGHQEVDQLRRTRERSEAIALQLRHVCEAATILLGSSRLRISIFSSYGKWSSVSVVVVVVLAEADEAPT